MRATDKEMLDWLDRWRVKFCKSDDRNDEYWVLEIRGAPGRSVRRVIDAMIDSAERRASGGGKGK